MDVLLNKNLYLCAITWMILVYQQNGTFLPLRMEKQLQMGLQQKLAYEEKSHTEFKTIIRICSKINKRYVIWLCDKCRI